MKSYEITLQLFFRFMEEEKNINSPQNVKKEDIEDYIKVNFLNISKYRPIVNCINDYKILGGIILQKFKLKKVLAGLLVATSLLALNPIGASAEWRQNAKGWWYAEGSSWATGWKLIDGKWYYFNSEGYMAKSTTIAGCALGSDGAWVQTSIMASNSVSEQENNNSMDTSNLLTGKDLFVNGTLSDYKDIDSYKFTIDSDTKINVVGSYEDDTLGLTKNVMIGIVNKDGKVIGATKETTVKNKMYKMLLNYQISAGTYYLVIVGGGENTVLWNNNNKYGVMLNIV